MQTFHIRFPNSNVPGLQIQKYANNEYTDHGAPCSLIIEAATAAIEPAKPFNPNPEPPHPFWESIAAITRTLNATPDHINLLPREIVTDAMHVSFEGKDHLDPRWHYPNAGGSHVYSGGEEKAYIDSIARDDVAIVADKAMREMVALGLITQADYADGLKQMADHGLKVEPNMGIYKRAAPENPVTYQSTVGGRLSATTEAWLRAAGPGRGNPGAGLAAPVYNAG